MPKNKLLMTPGPTMLPIEVLEAMSRQIIHHRTKEFESIFSSLHENLQFVFQTKNIVMMLASSGTGAMEAVITNLFSPSDKVLVVSIGAFGDRFYDICTTFGLNASKLEVKWGEAVNVNLIKEILDGDTKKEIKAVIMTHNETSTGVTNDIEKVAKLTKNTERLLVVDAISSLGGLEIKTDEWGIDAVITGSQKALMAPPGLSYICFSEKAWKAQEKSTLPKFYFDLKKYKKGILKELSENPPYTPAISLIIAQAEALKLIREEGLEKIYARHKDLAIAVQKGVHSLGLTLFPKRDISSYIITAVNAPDGIDIENVRKIMNLKYDIMITGGQKHLKGKIFRIGHCGFVDKFDIIKTFSALEKALLEVGYKVDVGVSVSCIQQNT